MLMLLIQRHMAAALAAAGAMALAAAANADIHNLTAHLDGSQEDPPNGSTAFGDAEMMYDDETNLFFLDVYVEGIAIADINGYHIHLAPPGESGPVIVNLGTLGTWVPDGDGIRLTINDGNFPQGNELSLLTGGTYINIHTIAFPAGEIRGQITLGGGGCKGGPFEGVINEVRIDQPSSDNDEYFELLGEPGTSLDGVYYVVIGDGPGGSGTVESITDLTGQCIPDDGTFLVAEETFTLDGAVPNLVLTGNGINFENSDNVTHLIVRDLNPAMNTGGDGFGGSDLDTDDDGVIDATGDYDGDAVDDGAPWSSILDCVGLKENDVEDLLYCGTTVGPEGTFVPGHVYRCGDDWLIGPFDPLVGEDTPGEDNSCAGACVATISAAEVTFGQNQGLQDPAKLAADDDDRTIAKSKIFLSANEPNLAVLEVTGDFSACLGPGPQVTIDVQDQASQPNVIVRVRLFPAAGGGAQQVGQYSATFNSDTDHQIVVANGGDYIDANGLIVMELRYSTIALLSPIGFDGRTDVASFTAE
jgi:hypothetical protein